MSNGMVYVGKVVNVSPIADADRIESVEVVCGHGGKWHAVSQVGLLKVDDLCEVYLPDSILPPEDRFDFMEKHGYRVRMMRFRGAPSEALVMPLSEIVNAKMGVGEDITVEAGVVKHKKPLPANVSGDIVDHFPSFIPKTDESNFQSVPHLVEALSGQAYSVTEKADGTSTTAFVMDGEFFVCSRNYILKETEKNTLWQVARAYDVEDKLRILGGNIALQWETVGPGIQGNPMGLAKHSIRVFDIYDIDTRRYISQWWLVRMMNALDLPTAPTIKIDSAFDLDAEQLYELAEGEYSPGRPREGIVIRPLLDEQVVAGDRLSFKVINLSYER